MQFDDNSHFHAEIVGWHANIHGFDNFELVCSHNLPAGRPAVVFHIQATERKPFKETTLT